MFACIYIPNASNDAQAALLDCAGAFSPRVENMPPGAVVFDVEGLERLFGSYSEIASKIAESARTRGLEANVALASNIDAAVCAARGFGGITVLNHGTEANRLCDLPPAVLSPSPEILETLERWEYTRWARLRNCRPWTFRLGLDRKVSNCTNERGVWVRVRLSRTWIGCGSSTSWNWITKL